MNIYFVFKGQTRCRTQESNCGNPRKWSRKPRRVAPLGNRRKSRKKSPRHLRKRGLRGFLQKNERRIRGILEVVRDLRRSLRRCVGVRCQLRSPRRCVGVRDLLRSLRRCHSAVSWTCLRCCRMDNPILSSSSMGRTSRCPGHLPCRFSFCSSRLRLLAWGRR